MSEKPLPTFIVDCPRCKAKVAAYEHGRITRPGGIDYRTGDEYYGTSVAIGKCPKCRSILVGESQQIGIEGFNSEVDKWADAVRVYPDPPKLFCSSRIPKGVSDSVAEGMKSLQANANVAACAMFGRALEALCRDVLAPTTLPACDAAQSSLSKKPIMLGEGIRRLKDDGFIDQRLFDWSQQLHFFRNLAAHPADEAISREDAEDLQTFAYAIIEYIYDLTDRYTEFKERVAKREERKDRTPPTTLRRVPRRK